MIGHDAAQSAVCHSAWQIIQLGTSLQEDHFAAYKIRLSCFCNVTKQGVAGGLNVFGQTFFGQRNVFCAAGGSAGFAEIQRLTFPQYIGFTHLDSLYIGNEIFVFLGLDTCYKILV